MRHARLRRLRDRRSARVAPGAGVELHRRKFLGPPGDPCFRVHLPPAVVASALAIPSIPNDPRWPTASSPSAPSRRGRNPAHDTLRTTRRRRSRSFCSVTLKIVVLLEVGRVAARAHVVPGLVPPRPMHRIAGSQFPIRIQLEPALTPIFPRAAVPGDAQRLKPAAGKPIRYC